MRDIQRLSQNFAFDIERISANYLISIPPEITTKPMVLWFFWRKGNFSSKVMRPSLNAVELMAVALAYLLLT